MIKHSLYLLITLLIFSCGNNSPAPAPSAAVSTSPGIEGFVLDNVPGTSIQKATKKDANSVLLEEGQVADGKRTGAWVSYFPKDGRVKSITQFLNGKKNGIYFEMNDRGSVNIQANYVNDVLHGKWVKYKFGSKPEKEISYNMGQYDGAYREYHNNGKLMKEVMYKNGVQDGTFKQFNDKEQVIMEYLYKNGEKVSGGIVTPQAE